MGEREIRTAVQSLEPDNTKSTAHRSKSLQSGENSENSGRDLSLDEDDDGSLPSDSPEINTIDAPLEDLIVV